MPMPTLSSALPEPVPRGSCVPVAGDGLPMPLARFSKFSPPEFGEYAAPPESLLRVMDAHGVEKAVLLQGNYFGFQNLYTWEAVQAYPDRFAEAASYDPFSVQADRIKAHLFDELGFCASRNV